VKTQEVTLMQEKELALKVANLLYDKKATEILVLGVRHLTVLADYLVIATGNNVIQTRALADHVDGELSVLGVPLRRTEGHTEGRWIVMDYASVIVHIFTPEDRGFYRLERLWSDGQNRLALPFEEESNTEA
jgi:ribosome-associated protein